MRRILIVGAPFGRFFKYFSRSLEARGVSVWRTVCDGGELAGTPSKNRMVFRGAEADWSDFLHNVMTAKHISAVITFNDSCWRTRTAHEVAEKLGVARYVLEEGYLRPWWITFEHEGVNGNSLLPKDPQFYLRERQDTPLSERFRQSFRYLVRDTITHYAACALLSPFIPFDPRYFGDSIWLQAKGYMREFTWRRTHSETGILQELREQSIERSRELFVALLQKPGDAQLRFHSDYRANNPFMRDVMESFAAHGSKDAVLVVKQHPLDYGVEDSPRIFQDLVTECGLEGRAFFVRKLTIESVLDLATGLITINSTGGMAAIERHVPTIALGKAIYDMPGLTFQDGLDRFWSAYEKPDPHVVSGFVDYLKSKTQVNGGYYSHQSLMLLTENLTKIMTSGMAAPHHVLAKQSRTRSRQPAEIAETDHLAVATSVAR